MTERPRLSVVLPVFNEARGLPELLARLDRLEGRLADLDLEVILVDDHSTDECPALLRQARAARPNLRVLRLSRNSGSHVAIYAGLEHATGDAAVFLASDLQDPPELILELVRRWRDGGQIVWAVRERREGLSLIDRLFIRLYYFVVIHVCRVTLPPEGSDFALLDRCVVDALLRNCGAQPSLGADIAVLGFRQERVPYCKVARKYGRSKWTLRKKLRAFVDVVVKFSYEPIRLMSGLGIAVSLVGFLYAAMQIVRRVFFDIGIEGWTTIVVAVFMLSGFQMIMLGIIGEYLCRALRESGRRPLYFIEPEAGAGNGGAGTDDE